MFMISKLNEKGSIIIAIALAFVAIILLPIVFMQIFSISKPLFQVIIAFVIMGYVRNVGIEGIPFWTLSAILIYFLAWKYVEIASSFYVLMLLMGLGFTSSLIWGSVFFTGLLKNRKMMKQG